MKTKIGALVLMLCIFSMSPAFARDYNHRGQGGYHREYRPAPVHRGGHHNNGLGIAFGIAGGLLLGSALMYSVAPPPPAVVYSAPYPPPPRVCFQDQTVNGQWRVDSYSGRRIWVPYSYPVTERVQVPCY